MRKAAFDVEFARAFLRQITLFQDLSDKELERVEQLVRARHYPKASIIFGQGEPVDAVFFLVSGTVKAAVVTQDGREQIMKVIRSGEFFPHIGFLDEGTYPATTYCMEVCEVGLLRREDFYRLVVGEPEISLRLLQSLSRQIKELQEKVANLGLHNVAARLAAIFLRMAEEIGTDVPQGVRIEIGLNQEELSHLAGTSRESVNRTLRAMLKDGSVIHDGQGTWIVDRERLQTWIN